MKALLIRSPRLYWPFINEYDNFLMPQSLACLAAVGREAGHEIVPIDCMPIRMGWKSLEKRIREERPDVVGVGDSESLYAHEAARVITLAKEINPNVVTMAGGAHFSNLIDQSLDALPIDFIVRGEGEVTFVKLLEELEKSNPDFKSVQGIAFKRDGEIVTTAPQSLIKNLDSLPMPAYDLMPMDGYGRSKYIFSPGGTTIHHSRGCNMNCKFCVWWVQMAERIPDGKGGEILKPCWRTKSVDYTLEEMRLLSQKYHKSCLIFVDDSFNANPDWTQEFSEAVLKSELDIHFFSFMRADHIVRDHKLGIFKDLVKAGLFHVCVGVERPDDSGLTDLGKRSYSTDICRECFSILQNHYPQVFRQATFIVGIRSETPESLDRTLKYAIELNADYPGFHPMTPVPGTELWNEAKEKGWIELDDFRYFDWSTPVMGSDFMTRDEVELKLLKINQGFVRPLWLLKGLMNKYPYKRRMYVWFFLVMLRLLWDTIKTRVNPFSHKFMNLIKPKWYDE